MKGRLLDAEVPADTVANEARNMMEEDVGEEVFQDAPEEVRMTLKVNARFKAE